MFVTAEGNFVSLIDREYDFADRETGERIRGRTRGVWVHTADDADPELVKVPQGLDEGSPTVKEFETLKGVEFGTPLRLKVELRGRYKAFRGVSFSEG